MIDIYEGIANLSPVKLELLAQQLKRRLKNSSEIQTVARNKDSDSILPLSLAQQRLWFFDQLEPGSAAYNVPAAVHLKGSLNVSAFEQSLNEIVRRHETLRTSCMVIERQPVQVIAKEMKLPLPLIDLQGMPQMVRQAEALRMAIEAAHQPFDLRQPPLLRAQLLRLDDEDHILLLTIHHIISDGWSVIVMIRELAALYAAYSTGQPSPLPELEVQYGDYAVWQREWLKGPTLALQLAYWKEQLRDAPPLLELSSDHPRPPSQSHRGAHQLFTLPTELYQSLKRLSQQQGVTLFMTLLAAFLVLLHYYTKRRDLIVGTDVAGRNRSEVEALIGFFVNQLVLRVQVEGDPSFEELLERVREVCLSAYAHQDVPFDRVVEVVNPERDLSYAPLFQVKLVLQQSPTEGLELPGLVLTMLEVESGTAQYDLILNMMSMEEGLVGTVEYSTDIYEGGMINQMLGQYERVMWEAVKEEAVKVSEMEEVLKEAEMEQQAIREKALEAARLQKFKQIRRKSINEPPVESDNLATLSKP